MTRRRLFRIVGIISALLVAWATYVCVDFLGSITPEPEIGTPWVDVAALVQHPYFGGRITPEQAERIIVSTQLIKHGDCVAVAFNEFGECCLIHRDQVIDLASRRLDQFPSNVEYIVWKAKRRFLDSRCPARQQPEHWRHSRSVGSYAATRQEAIHIIIDAIEGRVRYR